MIDLLHDDCMNVMAKYPDKYFELAIVDPPYGIGKDGGKMGFNGKMKRSGTTNLSLKGREYVKKQWDNEIPKLEYFNELFRVSKNQIIWGGNYFINNLFNTSCFIVWDKDNGKSNFADCELAWTSFNTAVRKFRFRWHGFFQENMSPKLRENKIHPTQKPVALYEWLLHNYAKPNDKILDTHLGSGSIAVACHDMGFDLVGVEIDADYYKAAYKRFKEQTMQLKLIV